MIVSSWNYRWISSDSTRSHARNLLKSSGLGALCFLETKTKCADKLLGMVTKLCFDAFFMVESLGFARGLLLVWNKDCINLSVVSHFSQVIHCEVKSVGSVSCKVSFSYVRPNRMSKDMFWVSCKDYANTFKGPWVLLGDFNDNRSAYEQWSNSEVNFEAINRFVEVYNNCVLLDVKTAGSVFSWIRKVWGLVQLRWKLDMVL